MMSNYEEKIILMMCNRNYCNCIILFEVLVFEK